jgi:hypothetical protein
MSMMPPGEAHITYQLQYRTCGKASCGACRAGLRHGPYWYAFWREGRRLRSGYIGKMAPPPCRCSRCQSTSPALTAPLPRVLRSALPRYQEERTASPSVERRMLVSHYDHMSSSAGKERSS